MTLPVRVEEALGTAGATVGAAVAEAQPLEVAPAVALLLLLALPQPVDDGVACGEAVALDDAEGEREAEALQEALALAQAEGAPVSETVALWLRLRLCERDAGGDADVKGLSDAAPVAHALLVGRASREGDAPGDAEALTEWLTEWVALALRDVEALGVAVAEGHEEVVAEVIRVGAATEGAVEGDATTEPVTDPVASREREASAVRVMQAVIMGESERVGDVDVEPVA